MWFYQQSIAVPWAPSQASGNILLAAFEAFSSQPLPGQMRHLLALLPTNGSVSPIQYFTVVSEMSKKQGKFFEKF